MNFNTPAIRKMLIIISTGLAFVTFVCDDEPPYLPWTRQSALPLHWAERVTEKAQEMYLANYVDLLADMRESQ